MAKTDLTNQRQVFVEEYVRSGDHLEAAKKADDQARFKHPLNTYEHGHTNIS